MEDRGRGQKTGRQVGGPGERAEGRKERTEPEDMKVRSKDERGEKRAKEKVERATDTETEKYTLHIASRVRMSAKKIKSKS